MSITNAMLSSLNMTQLITATTEQHHDEDKNFGSESSAVPHAVDEEQYMQTQRGNVSGRMVCRSSYAPLLRDTQPFFHCCPYPSPYLHYPDRAPEA